MPRSLSGSVGADIVTAEIRQALFVRFSFDAGTSYLWSGVGSITTSAMGDFPAATWTGAGTLSAASPVEETAELRATGRVFTLSGADPSVLSLALGEHVQGRPVASWRGLFDAAGQLIADPVPDFAGLMNQPEIVDDGATRIVRISAENRLFDFERPANPLFYLPEDQKRLYPGDRGFDFVASLQDKVIYWGRHVLKPAKKPTPAGGSRPGDGPRTRPNVG